MKVLITGASGMLGSDLVSEFARRFEVAGIGRSSGDHLNAMYYQQDLSDSKAAGVILEKEKPDVVFHAAAMTDVDGAEKERDRALAGNVEVTKNVVDACNRTKAILVFFSTDYVFDGLKKGEYTEEDAPHPVNFYGETKLLAEKHIQSHSSAFLIFRTSWLYGCHGRSFPRTILECAKTKRILQVVSDQRGRPTYARDMAEALSHLLLSNPKALRNAGQQIFNLANDGVASWAEFAGEILRLAEHQEMRIDPILTEQSRRPAARPLNSVLALQKTEKVLGLRMRHWKDAIKDFVEVLMPEGDIKK